MRSVDLAKVAASAEALRLRRIARRQALRAAYAAVAAVFAIAILVVLHVLLWEVVVIWLSPVLSTVVVLAVDIIVAAVFAVMALSNKPDAVELEARNIRQQALIELRQSLTFMSVVAQTAGLAFRGGARAGVRRTGGRLAAEMLSRIIGR